MGVYAQSGRKEKALDEPVATLEPGKRDTIRLPAQMRTTLGIQSAPVKARAATEPRVLHLTGSLALDPKQTWRVQARFAPCEVVEIGKADGQDRPLQVGDTVRKGQVLAVVTSAEVSQKMHDLFSALVQLKLDEEILKRVEKAADQVTEVFLLNARRNVEADHNAIARALNTLKVWGIPDDEIAAVRQEARDAADRRKPDTEEMRKARLDRWRKVTLRAPNDGIIVERNISLHEMVTDGTAKLFQIANIDRLLILAHVAEEDLPALQALDIRKTRGTIRQLQPDPDQLRRHGVTLSQLSKVMGDKNPTQGRIRLIDLAGPTVNVPVRSEGLLNKIGYVIDPAQRTALVEGTIDNKKHKLRPGQFIRLTITLPPAVAEVLLPSSALVEEDGQTFVFVQTDANKILCEQRRVLVVRRGKDAVHVRATLTAEQRRQGFQTVRVGDQIITAGALELKAILDDLKKAPDR
jgi:cobalt-zinc-cadmium efflux system membrane fusion protein